MTFAKATGDKTMKRIEMPKAKMEWLTALMVLLMVGAGPAWGQAKKDLIGSYRDWDAFTLLDSAGKKYCYMVSIPKASEASKANVRRGEIYVTVTHRPGVKVRDEVNVVVGYPFKSGSEARASIDGRSSFRMFTEGDGAWLYKPADDREMVQAMRRGSTLVVKGTSSRGTETTDRYSLSGFTAAHDAIGRACGY